MGRLKPLLWTGLALAPLAACSWQRFDDFEASPPVILVDGPRATRGFGDSLTVTTESGRSILLVGSDAEGVGIPFDVAAPEGANVIAEATWLCSDPEECWLARTPAGASRLPGLDGASPGGLPCFIAGVGGAEDGSLVLKAWCDDGTWHGLSLPDEAAGTWGDAARPVSELALRLAAARSGGAILAAMPEEGSVWAYLESPTEPRSLPTPESEDSGWGGSLAVLSIADEQLFVVGSSSTGWLRIYRTSTEGSDGFLLRQVGCIGDEDGSSGAIVTGLFDDDEDEDLAVERNGEVRIYGGADLWTLAEAASDDCEPGTDKGEVLATIACDTEGFDGLSGCRDGRFAEAIAAADFNHDGRFELAVAAPGVTVRGKAGAGAIFVYDMEDPQRAAAVHFLASPARNDSLGAALAVSPVGGAAVVAASVPGRGQVALFYCSQLTPDDSRFRRCR